MGLGVRGRACEGKLRGCPPPKCFSKRLQLRLLSDTLTGAWRNWKAGEGQGSEPREPGGLRHQAGDVS